MSGHNDSPSYKRAQQSSSKIGFGGNAYIEGVAAPPPTMSMIRDRPWSIPAAETRKSF
jgi:hypothetical protein